MHSTPFTTSPTSFGKYANFSIISFRFSFSFYQSIAFHFLSRTLRRKWLIHSPIGGLIVSPRRNAIGHTNAYGIIAPLRNAYLHTIDRERVLIVRMHQGGMLSSHIAENLGMPRSTISTVLTKWKLSNCIITKKPEHQP